MSIAVDIALVLAGVLIGCGLTYGIFIWALSA
jgi:hypothetical protein